VALVHVAYYEQRLGLEEVDDAPLVAVGVLGFIHEEMPMLPLDLRPDRGVLQ
jgi:hypothetical protein